jgi:hypothetical protein
MFLSAALVAPGVTLGFVRMPAANGRAAHVAQGRGWFNLWRDQRADRLDCFIRKKPELNTKSRFGFWCPLDSPTGVGGRSISSDRSSADRPHIHSGIFFLLASILACASTDRSVTLRSEPTKNFALSNTYRVTKGDGSADASNIASKLGIYFPPR